MDLTKILTITGLPGLYEMEAQRENGIIVSPVGEDKKRFVSSRQHMFTPLENITVYTEIDSIDQKDIFLAMKAKEKEVPVVKPNDKGDVLRDYFVKIAPEHDQDRVYTSDIKKILKWYNQLDKEGLVKEDKTEDKAEKEDSDKKKAVPEKKVKTKKPQGKPTTKMKSHQPVKQQNKANRKSGKS